MSGLGDGVAQNIVTHRDENGPFAVRKALKKVSRLGPKAFELSAGFLRIRDGDDPLDASGVHPEAYPVVRRIIAATKSESSALIGDSAVLQGSSSPRSSRMTVRRADRHGHPAASWKSPGVIRARRSRRRRSEGVENSTI